MNKVLRIDNINPKLNIQANLVPKLKCAPIFIKLGTQIIFRFLLIMQGLRNVKSFKSFFSRGAPYPVKYLLSNKELFEKKKQKNMFDYMQNMPFHFEM